MNKYKIIVNPVSGRGAGGRAVPEIDKMLREAGLDFDIVLTERPMHAVELAQQAAASGYNVVVAAGGDGTSNEVLNGLMRAKQSGAPKTAMGVLCVGRGNDFAFGMGAFHNLSDGCRVLAQGQRRIFDVGLVKGGLYPDGRYFGNGLGIGFDAVVGFESLKMKRLSGFPSYIVAALKTIFLYYHAPLVDIEYDGEKLIMSTLMISIMNGRRMGGGFMMAPNAKTDDGLFDLCIAQEVSRARIFALIPKFMQGTQASDAAIKTVQAKRVNVTARQGVLPVHADGETICVEGQLLTIEILPRQIEILV